MNFQLKESILAKFGESLALFCIILKKDKRHLLDELDVLVRISTAGTNIID